jgi:hypothetical protein
MKKTIFAIFGGAAMLALAGCVSTVNERTTPGVPFVKDKISGSYERSVDDCYNAARDVVRTMGTLANEGTIYTTNAIGPVKTVHGKVNQRNVWVRVEPQDQVVTSVTVQTRTPGGASDLDLAAEVEKRIALKLVNK